MCADRSQATAAASRGDIPSLAAVCAHVCLLLEAAAVQPQTSTHRCSLSTSAGSRVCRCLPGYLDGQGGDDALGVDQGGVAQVVEAVVAEDLCASLEPGGLLELDAGVLGQQLGGQDAQGAQEGPAGVDDLDLTVPVSVLCQAGWVQLRCWQSAGQPGVEDRSCRCNLLTAAPAGLAVLMLTWRRSRDRRTDQPSPSLCSTPSEWAVEPGHTQQACDRRP